MTLIKDLEQRILRLQDELNRVYTKDYFIEHYSTFREAINEFEHASRILDQETDVAIRKSVQRKKDIEAIINEIQVQIEKLRQNNMGIEVSDKLDQWFYNEYLRDSGFFGYGNIRKNVRVVWLSEDGKYGIATKVGNSYWDKDSLSTKYSPSLNWAFKIGGKSYIEGNVIGEIPDRLTNVKKQLIIDEIYNTKSN